MELRHTSSLSEVIADFVMNFNPAEVPQGVRNHAKLLFIDALGVAIAAYNLNHAHVVRKVAKSFNKSGESTLWGTRQKVSAPDAVLANGALIHGLDFDDTHVAAIVHPSACIVPTAFAIGESVGAGGDDILMAAICGYEIMIRLGLAAQGGFHDRGYHATGVLGAFASACVAARLLKVPCEVLVNALGICGSQAAALQEFLHDGSWVKKLHPGWASHSAIYALNLAREGFTGPREVFEGGFGLWSTHLGFNEGIKDYFADLGNKWRTEEISVKLYPCCHYLHSFIDCILYLQSAHKFTYKEIERVECRIDPRGFKIVCDPISVKRRPTTDYAMRFSLPFAVAMALFRGRVGPQEFDAKYAGEQVVLDLMDKVECVADSGAERPGHFPGWVKVFLSDGAVYEHIQKYERGCKECPISETDVIQKFEINASIHLSQDRIERMLQDIRRIEELDGIEPILEKMTIS
ncbi:MmgE/PrpD family protein [Neomoorella mulderi]|uniref:2-methylcitrate dehydratase n=1 Tax=Moorella mulderi DSM 14980 TaxID=1122241 RepID=A0A151AX18_9FIRM|nr:MmgE/PrpD family protein [Moorella mulderi]KYH32209.1 2-methylcitrate dehydratase [Moorella mulderi DSM 14980]